MISPRKGQPWPWNTIREPRPADWGIGMTVCIAAHCFSDNCIICATDMMVSTGEMSADHSARKLQAIGNHWVTMFAGNDMSPLTPILRYVRHRITTEAESLDDVANAFVGAYREQLRVKADNEILTTLGYTLEDFRVKGLAELGADAFSRLLHEIQQQVIDVSFLIAGYENKTPYIFTVGSPGRVEYYDEVGFWAIGAGQTNSLGSIFNSPRRIRFMDRAEALYRVCEAKFNAENAPGVGPTTYLMILYPDGARSFVRVGKADVLKPFWQNTRVINAPEGALEKAKELLAIADESKISPTI